MFLRDNGDTLLKMKDTVVWIFLHLPKSGGTTFNAHLYKHLKWDEEIVHLGNWGRKYRRRHNRKSFYLRNTEERKKIKVLVGHHTFYGIHRWIPWKEPRYITFLREPASRLVSAYNFQFSKMDRKPPENFDSFLQQRKNPMCSFYYWRRNLYAHFLNEALSFFDVGHRCIEANIFGKAKDVLDKCWYIGITEKLDQDLAFLFDTIGVPTDWKNYRVTGDKKSSISELRDDAENDIPKKLKVNNEIRKKVNISSPLDVELYRYGLKLRGELQGDI